MSKLTAIATYSRFSTMFLLSKIDPKSINFILDTGQIYTHGIFINGAVYGAEDTNKIKLTIAGTEKELSLASHTHLNYFANTSNIDITTYKIVSESNDLLYYSSGTEYIGNTSSPVLIKSNGAITTYRNSTEYTILDTGNFSITSTKTTGTMLPGVYARITYGSSSFELDYTGRSNTSGSTFDSLLTKTLVGTNTGVNNKDYGFITMRTDGLSGSNLKWAQLRVDIPGKAVEFRTSADTNNWIKLLNAISTKNVSINGTNYALYTSASSLPTIYAPTSLGSSGQVLGTDGSALTWLNMKQDSEYLSTLTNVSLTTSWSDIESLTNKLTAGDGSYIIQIVYAACMYTGIFSFVSGGTVDDEIILHCSGTVDSVGGVSRGRLFAKIGTTSGATYLRLATSLNESNAILSIKYRKLI